MVYAEGTTFWCTQPKGFARTAYVQSVDSANSKVIMSEVAQATLSVTDSTFWHAMLDTSKRSGCSDSDPTMMHQWRLKYFCKQLGLPTLTQMHMVIPAQDSVQVTLMLSQCRF